MAAVEEARPVAATAGASAESRMTANADAAAPALAKSEASAPAAAPATRQSAPMQAVRPAGEWLTAIQKLLDQERIDEAKASLDAFRKAYPDTPLPPAIRQRLLP
jgi:TolA-binding protein